MWINVSADTCLVDSWGNREGFKNDAEVSLNSQSSGHQDHCLLKMIL
jgi:hypothetical protein